jgi:hypothetical protein
MGYFILVAALFIPGLLALLVGHIPLTGRRAVKSTAARLVGAILMIPLPLYLIACKRSNVPPLASDEISLDPLMPETKGFVHLAGLIAALACLLAASVLAIVTSEKRPR